MRDAHTNLLAAIKSDRTRKIEILQAHGVRDSFATLFPPFKLLVRYSNVGIGYKDLEQVEKVMKQSGLLYVFARPARFIEGPATHIHFHDNKGKGIGPLKTITRKSVAAFLLDATEKVEWNGTTPVISN